MSLNILIADDNKAVNSAYYKILSSRGHTITCTENGLECFEEYKKSAELLNLKKFKKILMM